MPPHFDKAVFVFRSHACVGAWRVPVGLASEAQTLRRGEGRGLVLTTVFLWRWASGRTKDGWKWLGTDPI